MRRQRSNRDRFPTPLAWGLADLAAAAGSSYVHERHPRSLPTVVARMTSGWLQLIATRRTPGDT